LHCTAVTLASVQSESVHVVSATAFASCAAYDNTATATATNSPAPAPASASTRVPAGSVGIAGEFTGVYPRSSPGGWRLLGRTDADLWDLARTPPALLAPGTRVRFRSA
jgi:allophanate hydrolase subunit 1